MSGETPSAAGSRRPRYSAAKFSPSRGPRHAIDRPQLVASIDRGLETGLCLVLGSAGSGKTSALREWAASGPSDAMTWMNVDEGDAAPERFLQALVQAVRLRHAGFGDEALELMSATGEAGPDVVESLSDAFHELSRPLTLVLDDLHLAGGGVDRVLGSLVARRPAELRLLVGSRSEPAFDLGRLRAADAVGEIRDRDLLLDLDESRELLHGMGVSIDAVALEKLWRRTEGWAAGMHLAGVAMQSSADPEAFVDRLVSSSWSISHYLSSELLAIQPPAVVDFMLATCIVDELTPDLAATLAGGTSVTLAEVEAAHLMLYRNAAHPGVFRYHHLLRDQLRLKLAAGDPERERRLHLAAAAWYESVGDVASSFDHLWRADERDRAAQLLSRHLYESYLSDNLPEVSATGPVLTDADILRAPGPAIAVATLLCFRRQRRSAAHLADRIELTSGTRLSEGDRDDLTCLRTFIAASDLDMEAVIGLSDELVPATQRLGMPGDGVVSAVSMLVRAHAWAGEWAAAEVAAHLVDAERQPAVGAIEMSGALANVAIFRGHLGEGIAHARRSLALIEMTGLDRLSVQSPGLALLGCGLLERGDTVAASDLFERIDSAHEPARLPARILTDVALSRLRAAEGDVDGAVAVLESARGRLRHLPDSSHAVAYVIAHEARLQHAMGQHATSATLAAQLPDGHARDVAAARLRLADGDLAGAGRLIDRAAARDTCLRDDLELALVRLSAAIVGGAPTDELVDDVISLGERECFVFMLAEAGGQTLGVIQQRVRHIERTPYVDAILRAVPHVNRTRSGASDVEHLSDRELDVLRRLATSLSYREIADELFISVNTLKSHVKHTFRKLGADSRADALARARDAGYI